MSKIYHVHCSILEQDNLTDNLESNCSFLVATPVTLHKIKKLFPYHGKFHFRLKINSNILDLQGDLDPVTRNIDYYWKDLLEDDEILENYLMKSDIRSSYGSYENIINLRALLLSSCDTDSSDDRIEEKSDENSNFYSSYDEYFDEIHKINNKFLRVERQNIDNEKFIGTQKSILGKLKSGISHNIKKAQGLEIGDVVMTHATSIWNTVKATASHIQSNLTAANRNSVLTDIAEENLAQLCEELTSVYSDKIPAHGVILSNLWGVLFQGQGQEPLQFQRESLKWKEAGFQKPDPIADLKTTGILALKSMIYMGQTYPNKFQIMLANNRENIKSKYPFAIVAVNVTLLLTEVFNIRDQKYLGVQANYWAMFEDVHSFYEVFCACFFHIDNTWVRNGAVRAQFAAIIGEAKAIASQVLLRAPQSSIHFKHIANEIGMLIK